MSVEDINAERERIRKEIEALEKSLNPKDASIEVVVSDSDSEPDSESAEDLEDDDSDASCLTQDEERGEEKSDDETSKNLPASPETCLQINLVYQEVIQEKLQEVALLLSQNKERQEDILWQLSGPRITKSKTDDPFKGHVFIGRFMKPYFKDSATGCGPPANQDTREKTAQCIKSFQELKVAKWKTREKILLKDSVLSDSLQRLLQPKLFKHEYLTQKLEKVKDEMSKQIVEKQIRETLREIEDINQLSEERLVGQRTDEHDWEKISNIHFEGTRTASELRKFWQNSEHPDINKNEWNEEEVETLKMIAAKHNCTDWQSIANKLGTNRTAFQCLQKYQKYNKEFKKREWTKEEDQMLTHLVDQMRVGIHIPYQKIAYYMEGRDTFQLIYRWTKSVDPRLKKGFWTPEEDAKLLRAVSIYGERDWYKIREEVPGRSDSQCRDRYRKALNERVKKGRWSQAEKEKFLELIDKYGVGHWAKIASELPNRTDSQCLNKWKVIAGYKKKRGRLKKKHEENENNLSDISEEEDMSSESSSDEIEEMEIEFMDSTEDEIESVKATRQPLYYVPAIDLWVPTRDETLEQRHKFITALSITGSAQSASKISKVPAAKDSTAASRNKGGHSFDEGNEPVADAPWCLNTILRGFGSSYLTDVTTEDPEQMLKEACDNGKYVFRVNMADVRKVLKRNTSFQRTKWIEKMKKQCSDMYPAMSQTVSGLTLDRVRDVLQSAKEKGAHHNMTGLQNSTINRKLLMAVTPWVGNVIVIYSLRPASSLRSGTKADGIKKQVQTIKLSSTPVFTLLLQLFKIDADGCLQVIRERKTKQSVVQEAVATKPQTAVQPPKSVQTTQGYPLKGRPPRGNSGPPGTLPNTSNVLSGLKTSKGNTASLGCRMQGPDSLRRPFRVPKEKPKTVWELLKEKRMKDSTSSTSVAPCDTTVAAEPKVVAPQLLIAVQPEPGSSQPQTLSSSKNQFPFLNTSQAPLLPFPVPAASSAMPTSISLSERQSKCEDGSAASQGMSAGSDSSVMHNNAEHLPVSSNSSASHAGSPCGTTVQTTVGKSLISPSLQRQAAMPCPVPRTIPAEKEIAHAATTAATPGTKASISTAGSSVPIYSQKSILSLRPAVLPSQGRTQNLPNKLMPFTLVVTPQGLVSVPVHTVLGFSSASQQTASPKTELNVPSSCLMPLAGISGDKVSTEGERPSVTSANTNVTSSPAVPTSQVIAPSIKTVKERIARLKRTPNIISSASVQSDRAVPLDCPSTTESLTSGELGATSSSESSRPSFMTVLPPANKPMIISSAELQCSLSLISLSKGGVTELEESSSFQSETQKNVKKRPLVQTFSDTFVQSPKRPLTAVTRKETDIPKAECPVVASSLATSPAASSGINQIQPPVIIARSQTPATPLVVSKDMNRSRPAVSVAVRSPATQPLVSTNVTKNLPLMPIAVRNPFTPVFISTNMNQTRLPISFGARSAITPPHSRIVKKPNQIPVSAFVAKSVPTPSVATSSMNQIQSPVSVTAKSPFPASPLVASNENNQIKPPASIAVTNLVTPHMASEDKNKSLPLVSVAVTSPATQIFFSSNKNPIKVPVSIAERSPARLPVSSTGKSQIQPALSFATRGLATPPAPSNDKSQIQKFVTIAARGLVTLPASSKNQNQICPPVSVSAICATPVSINNQIHPPMSLASKSSASPPIVSNGLSHIHPPVSIADMSVATPPVFSTDKKQIQPPVSVSAMTPATPPVSTTDNSKNCPPVSSTEKKILDLSIVSIEEEEKVKSWLKGEHGVHAPPLKDALPYMPPSTCNLKTLSGLLQQKKVLEKSALRLLQSNEENKEKTTDEQLQAVREVIAHKLKNNPAYLLLKARFLSAFTVPAFLATLPPPRIRTTVRSTHYTYSESDDDAEDGAEDATDYDEMDSADDECKEATYKTGSPAKRLAKMEVDNTTATLPTAHCGAQSDQEPLAEASCSHAAPEDSAIMVQSTNVQTRRSLRLRKHL
ncbi:snRNA-activating protein complex subunit 4 isoform X1 [Pleurodeles waltl]|uniref:snRNA-activating protein complex subunit 4 isoform X1 n=1 Tax=Pleurodeles waltl TaxID=8319 RepID=UPI00370963E6